VAGQKISEPNRKGGKAQRERKGKQSKYTPSSSWEAQESIWICENLSIAVVSEDGPNPMAGNALRTTDEQSAFCS
jgi:hypothetical protein